jgi:hypothetical protein
MGLSFGKLVTESEEKHLILSQVAKYETRNNTFAVDSLGVFPILGYQQEV